jgi:threonine/homoserine/homoserine lactone efflux protein
VLAEFIPAPATLAAFSAAAFLLAITPGPDMTLFLARTIAGGRRQGFAAMAGAVTGLVIHAGFASVGLSALLAASSTAFTAVKMIGAGYLLYLAVQALRHGSALRLDPASAPRQSLASTFVTGLAINLTNPKIVLFFVTFLPQFVSPDRSARGGQAAVSSASGSSRSACRPAVAIILTAHRMSRRLAEKLPPPHARLRLRLRRPHEPLRDPPALDAALRPACQRDSPACAHLIVAACFFRKTGFHFFEACSNAAAGAARRRGGSSCRSACHCR